jgi:hypothetical protein
MTSVRQFIGGSIAAFVIVFGLDLLRAVFS